MRISIPCLIALTLSGCSLFGGPKSKVKASQLPGAYAHLKFAGGKSPLETDPIEFTVTGLPKYDSFFKNAATIGAQLVMAKSYSETIMEMVKAAARDGAALAAGNASLKEILKGRDVKDLSDDEHLEYVNAMKRLGKVSAEQKKSYDQAKRNVLEIVTALGAAAVAANDLVKEGQALTQTVSKDFAGDKAKLAPSVTMGLGSSVKNLGTAASSMPPLVKNLSRLAVALSN